MFLNVKDPCPHAPLGHGAQHMGTQFHSIHQSMRDRALVVREPQVRTILEEYTTPCDTPQL